MMPARQHDQVERELREFVVAELLEEPFYGDDPLAEGVVDSLGVEQLLDHISQTYGVELDDEELATESFWSIENIATLVRSKR